MLPATAGALLADPQTSGGLLVAVAPGGASDAVIDLFHREGSAGARAIGHFTAGTAHVDVS